MKSLNTLRADLRRVDRYRRQGVNGTVSPQFQRKNTQMKIYCISIHIEFDS